MSEWNRALKLAHRMVLSRRDSLREVEVGYHQYAPNPAYATLSSVVELLEDLMEEE